MAANCEEYAVRDNFATWASQLPKNDSALRDIVEACNQTICIAIWGEGNPDISGIGMIIGYVLDHVLGVGLSALVLLYSVKKSQNAKEIISRLLDRFFDCAAFLSFSVQVAAVVVLIKEEAGISTAGLGDGSVRITEAVSVLTLLPLLYPVVLLSTLEGESTGKETSDSKKDQISRKRATDEESKRFGTLVLCWLLAFFPFYCKMNNVFAPSKISDKPGSPLNDTQYGIIVDVCLPDVEQISSAANSLMSALAILAYIPMSFSILVKIIFMGLEKHHADTRLYRKLATWVQLLQTRRWSWILPGLLAVIPLLACGLIWTVMRVQRFQRQLSHSVGADDSDDQWTFGQVVAVTAFAPVLIDGGLVVKDQLQKRWERRPVVFDE